MQIDEAIIFLLKTSQYFPEETKIHRCYRLKVALVQCQKKLLGKSGLVVRGIYMP